MNKKLLCLLGLTFLFLGSANAQTKKIDGNNYIWADLQADYFLENQSFFYFKTQLRHNTDSDFAGISESGAFSNLNQVYFQLGYDQKLTEHWRAGVSARYTIDPNIDNQIYQAALQHNGKIGETDFIKRLAFDLIRFEEGEGMDRIRPMAALERNFKVVDRNLRPHLSYELFFYNGFREELTETRTVDRTRLRIAAGFQASKYFWVTPYFLKQTEYYNALTTYTDEIDADGNQVVKEQGGKRNRVEPIFGLELRFLLPGKNVSKNTIPNLGNLTPVAPATPPTPATN